MRNPANQFKRKSTEGNTIVDDRVGEQKGEAVFQWAAKVFLKTLVDVSVEEITLEAAQASFKATADTLKELDKDEREYVIRRLDFLVGRLKNSLEPVLAAWYKANRQ